MSYVLTPYLIDLEELRRTVGSRRQPLITATLDGDPNELKDSWETNEDAQIESQVSLDQAVRHLVMGEPLEKDAGSEYGYAARTALPPTWGSDLAGCVGWCSLGRRRRCRD